YGISSFNPVGCSRVFKKSGQQIGEEGPRYFVTISRHNCSRLYLKQ
ncbi:17175_t:CDS:1, partial [Racocetra persica]